MLGIKYPGHDTAAAVLREGIIVAAAEQERFDRLKHSNRFPRDVIEYCLAAVGTSADLVSDVAYYCDPDRQIAHLWDMGFHRGYPDTKQAVLAEYAGYRKRSDGIEELRTYFPNAQLWPVAHHRAHAASAYYPSGFDHAAILTIDGRGEHTTCECYHGRGSELVQIGSVSYPHSLGFVYGTIADYLGFGVRHEHYGHTGMSFDGEGKLMAIAAYGRPRFADVFRSVIKYVGAGNFIVDTSMFTFFEEFTYGVRECLVELLGPPRKAEDAIDQRHMDIAASLQVVVEECVLQMLEHIREQTGERNLCLAGGVFLNSCLNGAISRSRLFDKMFIQPAAGDAGTALGAALAAYYDSTDCPVAQCDLKADAALLGPSFLLPAAEAELLASEHDLSYSQPNDLPAAVASLLAKGAVVGWFQGRMEFGPRALGNRSILADPRSPIMREKINTEIKGREWFRPLGASVLSGYVDDYFKAWHPSPHMLLVYRVREEVRGAIPAVVHVDGSCRVQTVTREDQPRFYELIETFRLQTRIPMLLNTSLNLRGMPLCCTPMDAIGVLVHGPLSALVIGDNLFVQKP